MLSLKLQIFLMRFFRRIKTAYAYTFAINHNLRSPFTLMSANAQQANFVGFGCGSNILQIAKPSNLSQIAKTIVCFIAVNVVYMINRHFASYIKPRQSMRQSFNIVNGNTDVASAMNRSSNFSDKVGTPVMFAPNKNAGLRVITQRLAQMFNGNVRFNCHNVQFTILKQI